MNTTSCSVPPRQPEMVSSTPSSRTPVSSWPISSANSRRTVSSAYSPNSTCPPSGRWNGGSRESTCSDTSSAPSRGRLTTAIALRICRESATAATRPSYHGRGCQAALTILLHTALNPEGGCHVISFVGSMRGASLPRRSWYGIAGAALLIASGAIHLDLYLTGYNSIPTIGPLFLLQIIAAFVLAIAIPLTGHRLAYAAGALFALGVLGGYLLSLKVGLFGFTEVRTTAGIVAAIIDVAAFAVLGCGAVSGLDVGRRVMGAVGVVSVVALALTGVFVATPRTSPPVATGGSGQTLDTRTVGG